MAINKIDVQGTTTWIADVPTTPWADCTEAIAGLKAGKEALCPQTLGDLTRTREIQEYSCISNNESVKAAGKMSYGDFTIELLFDNDDTEGQMKLYLALENNEPIMLGLEASDADTSAGELDASGTIVWTESLVSGDGISYPENGLVGYSVTLSPYGGYFRCAMVPGHA